MKRTLSKERIAGNKIRKKIIERDGYKCVICGSADFLEVHHMKALYLGGDSAEKNLITLCSECHRYAPEEGTEANEQYIKMRNKVIFDELMNRSDIASMIMVAYKEFINLRVSDYVEDGIISEDQKEKILQYEIKKFF